MLPAENTLLTVGAPDGIILPPHVMDEFGLIKGDKVEAQMLDGILDLLPVAVYPEEYLRELDKIFEETERDYKAGNLKSYTSAREMFLDMGIDDLDFDALEAENELDENDENKVYS